jgi:hypothetical protein
VGVRVDSSEAHGLRSCLLEILVLLFYLSLVRVFLINIVFFFYFSEYLLCAIYSYNSIVVLYLVL